MFVRAPTAARAIALVATLLAVEEPAEAGLSAGRAPGDGAASARAVCARRRRLKRARSAPAAGSVVPVVVGRTRARVYFDRGKVDGLGVGAELEVRRRGRPAGRCTIDQASEHHASCADAGVFQRGDEVLLVAARGAVERGEGAAPEETCTDPRRCARPGRAPVESVPASIVQAEVPKVAYERPREPALWRPQSLAAEASAGYAFASGGASSGAYGRAWVDVSLRRVPLYGELRGNLDARVWASAPRPEGARYRSGATAELLLFEAAIEARELGRNHSVSVGRIHPWRAPGLVVLDGAQAGLRSTGGGLELGAFAGMLPELVTLEPRLDRWTAGLYAGASGGISGEVRGGADLRAAAIGGGEGGLFGEVELASRVTVGRALLAGAGARVAAGGGGDGLGLGLIRADVSVEPLPDLRLSGGYRERRGAPSDLDLEVSVAGWAEVGSRHADAALSYELRPGLEVGVAGGYAEELEASGPWRAWVGPEVSFPGLFGRTGSLAVGYQEERGWLDGRMGHVSARLEPWDGAGLLLRVSYLEDTAGVNTSRELGGFVRARTPLGAWLALDALVLSRFTVSDVDASVFAGPFGAVAKVAVSGSY